MEEEKRYTDKEQNAGYHTFFRQPQMNRGPFKRKTFLLKGLSHEIDFKTFDKKLHNSRLVFEFFRSSNDFIVQKVYLLRLMPV